VCYVHTYIRTTHNMIFRHFYTSRQLSQLVISQINPSAWSDEHCSSWRKQHLSWSDEHCSSWCTLSLIRLYLDNIGSKCNRDALCLFVKELALLWCGIQLLEIIYSFFLCSRILGFLFAVVEGRTLHVIVHALTHSSISRQHR